MSKKCPECGSLNIEYLFEENDSWCHDCHLHFPTSDAVIATVFDIITESVEALAEKFVYYIEGEHSPFGRRWKSTLTGDVCYVNRSSAFEATIEELKKEYKK